MLLENYLHGTTFLGLEFVIAPILGVIMGTLEGIAVGFVWWFFAIRPVA